MEGSGTDPWAPYRAAVLEFGTPPSCEIEVSAPVPEATRKHWSKLGLDAAFAVITAHHPFPDKLPEAENESRHRELAEEVARRKWVHVPCTGRSPDGGHEEPGLAVACGRREAISLARRFGQAALYWWDGEALWIEPALASTPREQLTPAD